jgi:hypothetical protein
MLSTEEVNVIGQITNTTFGYSSTGEEGYQVPAGRSIKANLTGETGEDQLIVKFVTIINIAEHESNLALAGHKVSAEAEIEAKSLVKQYINNLKKEFKTATKSTLALKEVDASDSIELINYNPNSPHRTVYYRRNTTYDVSA